MSLDKSGLQAAIQDAMLANITAPSDTQQTEVQTFSNALAEAIDTYVKGATIVYISGLTSPSGAVAGTFEGNLS